MLMLLQSVTVNPSVGSVWSICRHWRHWQHYQDDVCWHDVLVLGQVQFWPQLAHQGKWTWYAWKQHTWYSLYVTNDYDWIFYLLLQSTHTCCLETFWCWCVSVDPQHPEFFSFGLFSKAGPTRKQVDVDATENKKIIHTFNAHEHLASLICKKKTNIYFRLSSLRRKYPTFSVFYVY